MNNRNRNGKSTGSNEPGVHVHAYSDKIVPATCTELGYTLHVCTCGDEYKDSFTPLAAHDYQVKADVPPTCTKAGRREYVCSVCGAVKVEKLPAQGHSFGFWEVASLSRCEKKGYCVRKCAHCDAVKKHAIPAPGHKYGDWIEQKKPGCVNSGMKARQCSVCGAAQTEFIPPVGHDYSEWVQSTLDPDKNERFCRRCGKRETQLRDQQLRRKTFWHKFGKIAGIAAAVMLLLCGTIVGVTVYHQNESVLKYTRNDNGVSISAGKFYKADETLVIPSEHDGVPVTAIAAGGFRKHGEIREVVLPDGLIEIGKNAFENCKNLESVSFADTPVSASDFVTVPRLASSGAESKTGASRLEIIGAGAFRGCKKLTDVPLPDGLKVIGDDAFRGCSRLTAADLPEGLTYIGDEAFADSGLISVTIPESVATIGRNAFENCNGLTEIRVVDRDEIPAEWDKTWSGNATDNIVCSLRVWLDFTSTDDSESSRSQVVVQGKEYSFPIPSRAGYTFEGWRRGKTLLTDSKGASLSVWSYDDGGTATPSFTPKLNTVVFNGNGATAGKTSSQKLYTDETAELAPNVFSRTGYTFIGWSKTVGGEVLYTDGAQITMSADQTLNLYAVWQGDPTTLYLNSNGGTGETVTVTARTGDSVSLPSVSYSRTGYTLSGWSSASNGTATYSVNGFYRMGTASDYSLYAVWSPVTYSIDYSLGGGTVSGNPTSYTIRTGDITLKNPTRDGYSFAGWTGTDVASPSTSVTIPTGSTGARSYTANWTPTVYSISYDLGGGTVSGNPTSYTIRTGFTLNNPTRVGYSFAGWTGTGVASPSTSVTVSTGSTGNRTYTANWTPNTGTLRFLPNGGSGEMEDLTITSGAALTLPATAFSRLGYSFAGWALSEIGSVAYADEASVSLAVNEGEELVLYALWTPTVYSISYDLDGGTVSGNPSSYTVETDAFTLTSPTRDGYTFAGWTGTDVASPSTSVTIPTGSTGARSYTANWTPTKYSITYNLNGGINAQSNPAAYTIEEKVDLADPTCNGYTFAGWTGTGVASPSTSVTIPTGSTGDRSYIANWTPIEYSITYNLNGGINAQSNPAAYTIEEKVDLADPSRNGYTFAGWTGTDVESPSTSVTIPTGSTGDRAYSANWTPIVYSISYDLDGGSVSGNNPTTYTADDQITLISPVRDGYTFAGWTGTDVASPSTSVTIPTGSTGARTYTANWTPTVYSISYDLDGGSVSKNSTSYTVETDAFTLNNPTRNGYTFAGWTGTDVESPSTSVTVPTGSTGDRSYTANWTPIVYSISYDLDGGNPVDNPANYVITDDVTLNEPSRNQYTFLGWFTPNDEKITNLKGCIGDLSLTAKWKQGSEGLQYTSNGNGTCTLSGMGSCEDAAVVIPLTSPAGDKVTGIKNNAFSGCTGLTSLTIPDSVASIGSSAFYGCTGLTELIVPDGVTSIGSNAFYGCSGLRTLVIGNGVTSLPGGLLYGCSSLQSLTIPFVGNRPNVSSSDTYQYPFGYLFGTSSYTGSVSAKQSYFGASTSESTFTTYYLPATLRSVTVTGGRIQIGAFSYCSELRSITIEAGVTFINAWVFTGCTNLTDLVLNCSTSTIKKLFSNSENMNCPNLTNVVIGDNITTIGVDSFQGCSKLTSITIGQGVSSIYSNAFKGCTKLTSITYTGTIAEWNAIKKDSGWDNDTGAYVIHCTDGDIAK